VCAANWLRTRRVRHVAIIGPTYWTTIHSLKLLGIDASIVPAHHSESGFRLPEMRVARAEDAIWMTLPYYSTGVYLHDCDRGWLEWALNRGVHVVIDECLALPGREMLRNLEPHENLL